MLYRNTYLKIDLDKFHNNVEQILKFCSTDFLFVLKANAYGHGISVIAEELNQYKNITIIAVATLNEALKIKGRTNKQILIFGYLSDELLKVAVENDFIVSITELHQARLINNVKKTKIFINIDTGFHRLGKTPSSEFLEEIIKINSLENIIIEGIYTHLRLVDDKQDYAQYQAFKSFCRELRDNGVNYKYESISDSIALTRHPNYQQNLYRIGALMFGLISRKETGKIDVQPIQTLITKVTNIIKIKDGIFGYSNTKYPYVEKIATLAIGYADGVPRNICDKGYVVIDNNKCNIIGLPTMDQLTVDVTNKNISKGVEAIVFGGKGISLKELSEKLNTNKNELISMISSRVPRVYMKSQGIYNIVDSLVGEKNEY